MEDMAIPETPPFAMAGAWLSPSGAVPGAPIGILSDVPGNIVYFAPRQCNMPDSWEVRPGSKRAGLRTHRTSGCILSCFRPDDQRAVGHVPPCSPRTPEIPINDIIILHENWGSSW